MHTLCTYILYDAHVYFCFWCTNIKLDKILNRHVMHELQNILEISLIKKRLGCGRWFARSRPFINKQTKMLTSWDEQSSPRLRQLALSSFIVILAIAILIKYGTYLIILFYTWFECGEPFWVALSSLNFL